MVKAVFVRRDLVVVDGVEMEKVEAFGRYPVVVADESFLFIFPGCFHLCYSSLGVRNVSILRGSVLHDGIGDNHNF